MAQFNIGGNCKIQGGDNGKEKERAQMCHSFTTERSQKLGRKK